ncbi:hypothetical protein ACFVUY_42335 [Kitasatospora sp. NPDC058063]|uniref:hypothetical protein n=1 Tax=unclassified Kitasatospora TaxID=2633591 RepID=UPI0036DEE301
MYTYRCGVCRTISDHTYRYEAEDEQHRHINSAHDGRTPEQQSITRVGPPPTPPRYLPPPPPWTPHPKPLRHELAEAITKSPRSLAVTIAAVVLGSWLLYQWLTHLPGALPPPRPYVPPTATHTPLPLPTGQPLASLLASLNAAPPTPR